MKSNYHIDCSLMQNVDAKCRNKKMDTISHVASLRHLRGKYYMCVYTRKLYMVSVVPTYCTKD